MGRDWESSEAPCPKRGPGLTHMQDKDQYRVGYCCFCRIRILFPVEIQEADMNARRLSGATPDVDFDLQARLDQLGLGKSPEPSSVEPDPEAECILEHASLKHLAECPQCGVTHEGRFITDLGPQGTRNAYGRGEFTERQQARLLRHVEFVERYGKEGK